MRLFMVVPIQVSGSIDVIMGCQAPLLKGQDATINPSPLPRTPPTLQPGRAP